MPKGPNIGYIRPEVARQLPKWTLVDDVVEGEDCVKAKGETYLPKPETNTDLAENQKAYAKYKTRATFYPVTGRTLEGLVGQVFQKPVTTEIPSSLELLTHDIDGAGTTLEQQAKESLEGVLKHGRGGLLSDFPPVAEGRIVTRADIEAGSIRPRIIFYAASQIINWRVQTVGGQTRLSLLVLRENQIVGDDGYEFQTRPRWREFALIDGKAVVRLWRLEGDKETATEYEQVGEDMVLMGSNRQPLSLIPFSFIGANNNDSLVDDSPLYPLAKLNIHHFHNSADYEQGVFLEGCFTPVFTGLSDAWVKDHINGKVLMGATNPISLPQGADAKLLQAQSKGLALEAMKHKEDQMKAIGAKLIEPGSVQRTATEAEIEETSEASVLSSVAKNVSAAYEQAFRFCSLFGEEVPPEDISIALNSEFQILGLNAQERQEVMAAWQGGLLAWEEARDAYRRKGIAYLKDDDARTKIANEALAFGGPGDGSSGGA